MPRIEPLAAPYPPQIQGHFDAVMKGARPLVLFTTIATSERAWGKFRAGSLLDGRVLSLREREIVIDRACARSGCEYEWGVHVAAFAAAATLTRAEIAATLEVPLERSKWPAREAALIATVDALHERAKLSDAEFAELKAHFDDEQIQEVLLLCGFYRTVAYIVGGLDIPLETTGARFADYAGRRAAHASPTAGGGRSRSRRGGRRI